MLDTYSTADQFCHGMTYREWRDMGNTGRCPYHSKMLRNFNKTEAIDIAKKYNMGVFFCELSHRWHLTNGPSEIDIHEGETDGEQ